MGSIGPMEPYRCFRKKSHWAPWAQMARGPNGTQMVRAQMVRGPNGPGPNGPGPKWGPNGPNGPGPNGPDPKWPGAQMGPKWSGAQMVFGHNLDHMAPFATLEAGFCTVFRRASFPGVVFQKSDPPEASAQRPT